MAEFQSLWETQTNGQQGQSGPQITTTEDSGDADVTAPTSDGSGAVEGGPVAGAIEGSNYTVEEVQVILFAANVAILAYLAYKEANR
ncbi:hypothetical protein ACFQMA_09290 [Halosimplex aquaticum]|uniref:PGF-CTERM protein n=1 Tax=Halosimplex aquaticum TaxID=3026162 RepID=A0ABD5XZF9_9EURY|nr:hypothetical protein [Halosimplex aquaticum]